MNDELWLIYLADRADRRHIVDDATVPERDGRRRDRVDQLIAAGALSSGLDYYHAAMVFQHGSKRWHFWRAHVLAIRATELGHPDAWWLAAASYDRWLISAGLPQRYGTQYRIQDGQRILVRCDSGSNDAEQTRWDVPSLGGPVRGA